MKNILNVLPFVALTFLCWGVYGPVLHIGQEHMADMQGLSTLRPFICVGIAYFLIAVVFPLVVLYTKGEKGNWSFSGTTWSFAAGLIGAIGALGIILAFKFKGAPVYVMPLVFGCAPVVNTFVTMLMTRTFHEASRKFFLSILVVAIGAAGVMAFKPAIAKKPKPVLLEDGRKIEKLTVSGENFIRISKKKLVEDSANEKPDDKKADDESPANNSAGNESGNSTEDDSADGDQTGKTKSESSEAAENKDAENKDAEENDAENAEPKYEWVHGREHRLNSVDGKFLLREYNAAMQPNLLMVALSIILTAACWGSYGPVLHRGQMKMDGSKMRPFICVGMAYFAIAVLLPSFLLPYFPEKGAFDFAHFSGISWSLFAGAVGAVGALGIIYAFNFGGKPILVMPLVFGMAPVVNTFTTITTEGLYGQLSYSFMGCLLMVILGAVCVLLFAPRPKPKPAANPPATK